MERRTFLGTIVAAAGVLGWHRETKDMPVVAVNAEMVDTPRTAIDLGATPSGYVQCVVEFETSPSEDTELYLVAPDWDNRFVTAAFVGVVTANPRGPVMFLFHAMENQSLVCTGSIRPTVNFQELNLI